MNNDIIWSVVDTLAKNSECEDRQVGCAIYHKKLDQIVGKGWNIHLDGICDCHYNKTAQHAEITAINDMLGPYKKEDLVVYVNHRPCDNCAAAVREIASEVRYKDQKG